MKPMKILILEENPVIRDMLGNILTDFGHEAHRYDSTGNLEKTLNEVKPGLIILDAGSFDVKGNGSLKDLDVIGATQGIDAIILCNRGELMPKDNPSIKGAIFKPFRVSDIRSAIETYQIELGDETEQDEKSQEELIPDGELSFGRSYVFYQRNPHLVDEIGLRFNSEGHDVLIITPHNAKQKKRFSDEGITIMSSTAKHMPFSTGVFKLGTMVEEIRLFIARSERPIIIFDELNPFINVNGINAVLMMLNQIITSDYHKKFTVLASVDDGGFSDRDREILHHMMKAYNPEDEK